VQPLRVVQSGNLPTPYSSFVGREREIAEAGRRLRRARLLTLTGAGGVGKSRLALEVATRQRTQFADGCWLVELAALTDASLLPQAVVAALGLREQPGQTPLDLLTAYLQPRSLLLILDNAEHLADACATLASTLLRAAPGLRLLATSRLPLGMPGETLWRVPSITLPLATSTNPDEIRQSEAARLFLERAHAALRTFHLPAPHAPALATLCRRLDGVPLAIELAAAMVPAFSVEQIAARLDDRFALLMGGSRASLPRHRTLRALVDWSYDRLDVQEQRTLQRLAVFAGGWTLEAAERVVEGESSSSADDMLAVRGVLARLVSASLVVSDEARGQARFSMLETIREYALEKLRASGEAPLLRTRHLAWAVDLVAQGGPQLVTADRKRWSERLSRDLPNLRAALTWSLESGDIESGLRIASDLWRFWEQHGHVTEARGWFGALLAGPSPGPSVPRARALAFAGYFAYLQGDGPTAQVLTSEALALARTLDDPFTFVAAIQTHAILVSVTGDLDRTEAYIQEGLERSRATGLEHGVRISLLNLGELARMRGDDRAEAFFTESSTLSAADGDAYTQASTLFCYGHYLLQAGRVPAAAEQFARSLRLWCEIDDAQSLPDPIEGLAWAAAAEGKAERAARLLGVASALRDAVGTTVYPRLLVDHQRATERAQAALGERTFSEAWERGRVMPREPAISYALDGDSGAAALTPRERQIVLSIAGGRLNREIGADLGVSERTVEWHITNVFGKIGVRSRAQIAAWAVEHGIVPTSG